ncbi:hypothetical protein [Aggregatibacter actinomycetemcomitans]|nr:hypothetical protein [Aggregatibacter actinomycetemcomitans]
MNKIILAVVCVLVMAAAYSLDLNKDCDGRICDGTNVLTTQRK